MEHSKKKILFDTCLNIVAAAIPIIYIQLLAFPLVAKRENVESYGLMVAMYAIMMFTPNISGNALANLRLIKRESYENRKGDFNLLVFYYGIINALILICLFASYYSLNNIMGILLACIASMMTFYNAYYEVDFSLKLNFRCRLLLRICLVAGYFFGTILYFIFDYWELIFIGGQVCSSLYIYKKSCLYKEPWGKTEWYKETKRDSMQLVSASCLSSSLNYVDKLLLFPLLGASIVSVYNVATVMGKIVLLLVPPINSLVLSYISHAKKVKKILILKVAIVCICVCSILGLLCILLSKYILQILYPQFWREAIQYVPITSLMVIIAATANMIQTFVLRFCDIKWQTLINGVAVAIYFSVGLVLVQKFGLYGFCFGYIVSYTIRLILLLLVFLRTYDEGKEKC